MPPVVDRPGPEDYQPPLAWWGHAWRVLVMLGISTAVWFAVAHGQNPTEMVVDVALGVPAYVLVFLRRRHPLAVAVAVTLLGIGSAVAAGPATLAIVSLATRRRWIQTAAVAALALVSQEVFNRLHPADPVDPAWVTLTSNVVFVSASVAWGMYLGSRRELLWTLRARADRAETEQLLLAEKSRLAERGRIAREMHDVLAHRITQISMRAGALSYREDLGVEEMREGASVIRETAHQALTELRDVLGVLRERTGELTDTQQGRPQPTYDDVKELVAEARRGGQRVSMAATVSAPDDERVPEAAGRTVYRIIQEGLTNARKHAPGAALSIDVTASPADGIAVTLRNPLGFRSSGTPGSGLGLVGLTERTELRGGHLEHRHEDGDFVVRGWIPWAA